MNKRPLAVTIIGIVYILTGAIGVAFHLTELRIAGAFQYDVAGVELVRLIAILCGVYMLRGRDWARWLALAWMAFHVVLSFFHSRVELAMHAVLFAALVYFLLRRGEQRYFRPAAS